MKHSHLTPPQFILSFILCITLFIACKKEKEMNKELLQETDLSIAPGISNLPPGSTCVDMMEDETQADSILTETILGDPLNGHPYSVANMHQAAINLYGNNQGIVANKIYMRCKPANEVQLEALEASDAEWFDYPLDRDVLHQGEYYTQAGIGAEEIPWLYAVVDITYTIPAGISYEIIENIYVPDYNLNLEQEAFRITGNSAADAQDCFIAQQSVPLPPPCDPTTDPFCQDGGDSGGNTPPGPKNPAGSITVEDTQLPGIAGNHKFPLRQTRVVCKRFLKIVTTYTDDNGHFAVAKKFKNKVHIIVKFKNNNITTRGLKGARFWQMKFPVKHSLGKYSGTLNNVAYTFERGSTTFSSQYRNWWGAQVMNAYLEYNEMAAAQQTGQLPTGLYVLLTGWHQAGGTGSTTMDRHRAYPSTLNLDYIGFYIVKPLVNARLALANYIANGQFMHKIDMSLGYYNINGTIESDRVKQLMYHEMSHAAHFNKVGEAWYSQLTTAELYTVARWGQNSPNAPYGIGDDGNISRIIALGESWAEHIGQFFTDTRYGVLNSSSEVAQGNSYFNNSPVAGLSSHLNLLENYNPGLITDNTHWIPYGVYYDMIDNRNDEAVPAPFVFVTDQVSTYRNQLFFNALDNTVNSVVQFKNKLIQQNPGNQFIQINDLFIDYGY